MMLENTPNDNRKQNYTATTITYIVYQLGQTDSGEPK